ncbi:hypothetical protein AB0299_16500 [Pseudarthrobacter sp. NPDC080037]
MLSSLNGSGSRPYAGRMSTSEGRSAVMPVSADEPAARKTWGS